ncbi:hypothetical protein NSTC745_05595 [Nostoc sp. DSM 114161]
MNRVFISTQGCVAKIVGIGNSIKSPIFHKVGDLGYKLCPENLFHLRENSYNTSLFLIM